MGSRRLMIALCVSALYACGQDGEPECTGNDCSGNTSLVEAGTPALDSGAAPSPVGQSDAGANPGSATGNDAGPRPDNDSGKSDAGPAASNDAGRAPSDASTVTPSGDAGGGSGDKAPKPSAGCGMPAPMSGKATIDVSGTSREYILTLPQNYDPTKPYKLIFAWHGLGGTADQIARTYYGLASRAQNSAIFVAGQGLNTSNQVGSGPGWDNMGGRDVAFVKALYARLQGSLCIDESRVFSVGMSYGGIMSNTLGCQMGDVFRAIAPMAGSGPGFGGRANCVGEVAVWMSHGDNDTVVSTASGQASRDFWVKANKCQMQTMPVDPSPCVA